MGVFGFFLFLSVLVASLAWRSIAVTKIRQEALVRILESGQTLDNQQLALLVGTPIRPLAWKAFKIGALLLLGFGAIMLALVYWQEGTLPLMVTGLFALLVAFATWSYGRNAGERMPHAKQG